MKHLKNKKKKKLANQPDRQSGGQTVYNHRHKAQKKKI